MARTPTQRQCSRCGYSFPNVKECPTCGVDLVKRRWKMTRKRIAYVHALALQQKGLTHEEYKLRMQAITTKTTCKDLTRNDYKRFTADLQALPDVRRAAA